MRTSVFKIVICCLIFVGCITNKRLENSIKNTYTLRGGLELKLILDIKYDTIKSNLGNDGNYIYKSTTFSYQLKNNSYKPIIFNSTAVSWNYTYQGQLPDSSFFRIEKEFYGEPYRGLEQNVCGFDWRLYPTYRLTKQDTINNLILINPRDSIQRKLLMYECAGENDGNHFNPPFLKYKYKGETAFKIQLLYNNLFSKIEYDSIWKGNLESEVLHF